MSSPCSSQTSRETWNAGALSLYRRLLPAAFWDLRQREANLRQNNRVYTLAVVTWLMIGQWLHGHSRSIRRSWSCCVGCLPAFGQTL